MKMFDLKEMFIKFIKFNYNLIEQFIYCEYLHLVSWHTSIWLESVGLLTLANVLFHSKISYNTGETVLLQSLCHRRQFDL